MANRIQQGSKEELTTGSSPILLEERKKTCSVWVSNDSWWYPCCFDTDLINEQRPIVGGPAGMNGTR